ncbi:phosphoribosylglycinamide formyltransferase [Emticicia oligotrophica DSM 17448]|uniref:Phosphoribosylglycinamide formyltransferase n=1 Tax=Emticicia oligotrophica (strain DSM 17448 / CIP 109782 / MTCC 6937 / GPTSA100-15) TaxID=929562 RepID=A0ABN4AQU1_EMTOG|nr:MULTISPECIES: phosphoribosylglycinamide formyltransferase [Emticicia]AFK04793.1 phosphoribosylglycinamide formyltransferase [Emticicia oligotrophica DSM 17448]
MKRIAIFASGSGSNAERIATYFAANDKVSIELFLTNNPTAGVIERGRRLGVPTVIFDKKTFSKTDKIVQLLQNQEIDLVILAGFLWLIPENLIKAYPNKIVNIHPALLPKYGGKGMWGHFVHEAVVAAHEKESGITIHYVNEHYDEGEVIFQAKCEVVPSDTPEDVAKKVQLLEHIHFPEVIEKLIE